MNTIVAGMPEEKAAVPPEENARIVSGTLRGKSEIRAGLGKRFRIADEFINHLEKLWIRWRTPKRAVGKKNHNRADRIGRF